jgi:hypothetical protein
MPTDNSFRFFLYIKTFYLDKASINSKIVSIYSSSYKSNYFLDNKFIRPNSFFILVFPYFDTVIGRGGYLSDLYLDIKLFRLSLLFLKEDPLFSWFDDIILIFLSVNKKLYFILISFYFT